MTKHSKLLWIMCIALGWIFDLLFWRQGLGINFALFALLCLLGGLLVLTINKQVPARSTLWLIPAILAFAAITFIRTEPLTLFLAVVFTLFLMMVLANTFLGGRWLWYAVADYVSIPFRMVGSMLSQPLGLIAEVRKEQAAIPNAQRRSYFWPVVRGIVIALPVLAIFASLLASADAVFNSQLNIFLKFFQIENLPQYIFRLAYILAGGYLLVGVILHASTQSRDEKLLGEDKPLVAPLLGFTEAVIVLGSVAILFAAFVVIQFRYFFGGQANITVVGFTYSEYARRGFGELVAVAFFSLLMILGLGALTRRESPAHRRIFSTLSAVIVAFVMVMLVSAYQRLVLYETAYGFSRLRTYTHVALVWIALLLVTVVILEIIHKERQFALAAVIASIGFAASLAVLNVDGLIVKENVQRAMQGSELDVPYLASLSQDSVPALVSAFETPSFPASTRDAVGAALFCRIQFTAGPQPVDQPTPNWRSFSVSRWQSEVALKRVDVQLKGYHYIQDDRPLRITSPAGTVYDCYGYGMD